MIARANRNVCHGFHRCGAFGSVGEAVSLWKVVHSIFSTCRSLKQASIRLPLLCVPPAEAPPVPALSLVTVTPASVPYFANGCAGVKRMKTLEFVILSDKSAVEPVFAFALNP